MKLFFDANVLFTAAHNPNGKAALVVALGAEGHWAMCTSRYAIDEASRNLTRKFPDAMAQLDTIVATMALTAHRSDLPHPLDLARKDIPIFQAALVAGASHLLTCDIKRTHGIEIMTVGRFLETTFPLAPNP